MKDILIAGTDEVGRGSLAGPVIAAAVILKENIKHLNDSKKLSNQKRIELAKIIYKKSFYSFGIVSAKKIDEINIHNASLLAMKRAILKLTIEPKLVLIDGKFKPNLELPMKTIIRGDSKEDAISAASIIAKVYRDSLMKKYATKYPQYYFDKNKGYGTKQHYESLKKFGFCKIHRMTFKGVCA